MPLNFPGTPSNNQIYYDSTSGNRYKYDAVNNLWFYFANNVISDVTFDTQVLFNDTNSANGSYGLTFNKTANTLTANTINAYYMMMTAPAATIRMTATTSSRTGTIGMSDGYNMTITGPSGGYVIINSIPGITQFLNNGTEIARFNSGNLGIGTTSPTRTLDVANGSIALSTNATYIYNKDGVGNSFRSYGINSANNFYIGPIDGYAGGAILYGVSPNVTEQYLYTSGTSRLYISSTGSVGIGNTSPLGILDVYKSSSPVAYLRDDLGVLRFITTGGINYIQSGNSTTSGSNAPLVFSNMNNGSEWMRITANGNVGIGLSNPDAFSKLAILGAITSGTATSTNGTVILRGYYGIGAITTFGTEYSSGGPVIGYGVKPSTSAAGSFISSSSTALARGAYTIPGNQHVWYSGAPQTVAEDSAVTLTEKMRLDASGNLGIGMTPGYKLDVAGSIRSTSIGMFYTQGSANLTSISTNAFLIGTLNKAVAPSGGTGVIQINSDDAAASALQGSISLITDPTAANRRLTIGCIEQGSGWRNITLAETAGNVGIGNTSPGAKLHIAGANTIGGIGYSDFLRVSNDSHPGVTNKNKTFRLNSTGGIEIVNNAYSAVIFTLDNNGILATAARGITQSSMPAGTILQVQTYTKTSSTAAAGTANQYQEFDSAFRVSITPTSSTSKILLTAHITGGQTTGTMRYKYQYSTDGGTNWSDVSPIGDVNSSHGQGHFGFGVNGDGNQFNTHCLEILHSPATTSAIIYRVQFGVDVTGTYFINRSPNFPISFLGATLVSTFIAKELAQ